MNNYVFTVTQTGTIDVEANSEEEARSILEQTQVTFTLLQIVANNQQMIVGKLAIQMKWMITMMSKKRKCNGKKTERANYNHYSYNETIQ